MQFKVLLFMSSC